MNNYFKVYEANTRIRGNKKERCIQPLNQFLINTRNKKNNVKNLFKKVHDGNCNLADDEEGMLVNKAMLMASLGEGLQGKNSQR